ncbi:MAG: ATP-dependent helicase RecG, partial [Gaiellales bacterium]|nr:ATP-dependent helicase RecG [Gaiellales bacterium]
MIASRRQTVFASLDPPQAWPATRRRPQPQRLDRELDTLPGVGVALKRRLAKLGLHTIRDLLQHRPHRYESAVDEVAIASLGGDQEVAIAGEVLNVSSRRRGRLKIVTAKICDGTASIKATWFNQPWLEEQLRPGTHVRLRGKPGRYGFDVKSYDVGKGDATADFAPVYPASEEIPPKRVRTLVGHALGHVVDYFDPLPADLRQRERMPLKRDAIFAIHRPEDEHEAEIGRQRLAFEELLLLQVGIARRAAERERTLAPSLGDAGELIERYRLALPFVLT